MDIDTTPPAAHHDGRPAMQLDLPPSDDVMMEVDPDCTVMSASLAPNVDATHPAPASSPSAYLHHLGPGLSSPTHPSSTRAALDGSSPAFRPLPVPPVVLISGSDSSAWPKFKLDQLFVEWLARPESRQWLDGLLEEARAGKAPELLVADQASRVSRTERAVSPGPSRSSPTSQSNLSVSPQQAPGSPVSRLFSNHIPFGDSDSSPRSPPAAPTSSLSPFRPNLSAPLAADFDLGRSGSVSPLLGSQPPAKDAPLHVSAVKLTPQRVQSTAVGSGDVAEKDKTSVLPQSLQSKQCASSEVHPRLPSEPPAQLEQVPDSKVLDRVTDRIAGMTAAVDLAPIATPDSAEMRVEVPDSVQTKQEGHGAGDGIPVQADSSPEGATQGRSEASDSTLRPDSQLAASHVKGVGDSCQAASQGSSGSGSIILAASGVSRGPVVGPALDSRMVKQQIGDASGVQPGQGQDESVAKSLQQRLDRAPSRMIAEHEPVVMDEGQGAVSAAVSPAGSKATRIEDSAMLEPSSMPKKRKTLPRFYFPCGRDANVRERKEREAIKDFFKAQRTQKNLPGVSRTDIAELVVEVICLPSYFASIIFNAIQEVFPPPSALQESGHSAGQARSLSSSAPAQPRDEVPMKDVVQNAETTKSEPGASEAVPNRGSDSGATNSDTTMGDINDMQSEERRANGFHTNAEVQGASAGTEPQEAVANEEAQSGQASAGAELVSEEQFTAYYDTFCSGSSKEGRLFSALRQPQSKRSYLIPSDFKPLLRALLMCHQGLAFLHATPEFQQRYSETVIERIYFGCTRQHNGRLTLNDIKRSKLLDTLMVVDEEEDINRERKYFSYEHFYVLYCRFWELDANHDLQIDREDLMRYGSHSLTYRIVDRIFGGYARPLDSPENPGFMSYTDFIWFCLSEEDKTSDTAIDYWFRCVDMDGDGLITMYDMEFFYKEQLHRMECFGHEPVQIRDILCQLLDMINPNVQPPVIRRRDLKRCRLAGNFFNVLFNLNKFFAIDARDPLQIRQEHATPELTDWDRFAALEYLRLSAEEEGEEDESWEDVGEAANPLMAGEAPF